MSIAIGAVSVIMHNCLLSRMELAQINAVLETLPRHSSETNIDHVEWILLKLQRAQVNLKPQAQENKFLSHKSADCGRPEA